MTIISAAALATFTGPLLEPLRKGGASGVELGPPPKINRKEHPYRGTIDYQGLVIYVENPTGSVRRGVSPAGVAWATTMTAHYGEFAGTLGVDGDAVDVFVGDDPDAPIAYVVHRKHPGTEVYDEDKVIVGVRSAREAEALFRANYDKPGNIGGVTPWPIEELRDYLAHPAHEGKRLDQPQRVRLLMRKSVAKGHTFAHAAGMVLSPTQSGARRWRRLAPVEHVVAAEVANHVDELGPGFLDDPRTVQIASRAGWKFHVRPSRYHGGHYVFDTQKQPITEDASTVSVDPVARTVTVRSGWEHSPHAGAILRKLSERKSEHGYDVREEKTDQWQDGRRERESVAVGKLGEVAGRVRDVDMVTPERRDHASGYKLQKHRVQVVKTPDEMTWYHATRASSVPSIMEHGLVPGKKKQGEGWTQLNLHLQRANYLTHDPDYARRIAETLAEMHGEKAVVLKVNGKALGDSRKIVVDEDTLRNEHGIASHEGTGARTPAFYHSMHDSIASVGYGARIGPEHLSVHTEHDPEELEELEKGVRLYPLLKATIRTPTGADGKVDYESVPVGASIWVRVTDPHSPLHGRPILLTKRPDHQFAMTGGSGAKHIQARRHLVLSSGRARASVADEKGLAERQAAEERNAPLRARQRDLRKQARGDQRSAEEKFMEALGITRRGLTKEEKARVHEAARAHAEDQGLSGRDAESFARHMADGIARKEREFRLRQAAHRLELARNIAAGRDPDEAETMAGPAPAPAHYTPPDIDPETWAGMSEPEREANVHGHLEQQDTSRLLEEMNDAKFEAGPADVEKPPAAPTPTPTPTPTAGQADEEAPTDAEGNPAQPPATPQDEHVGTPTETPPGLDDHDGYADGGQPDDAPEHPPVERPTFAVGQDDPVLERGEGDAALPPALSAVPEAPARPQGRPILSEAKAKEAIEHFRAYAAARKTAAEVAGALEKLPESESAMPSAVEDLRLRLGAVDDDELNTFLDEYQRQNGGPPDGGFYSAMSPHWNDDVGNKLAGAVTRGAASAITGIVGEELGARFDVQRLVDALGPEAASMAVVHRMREELGPEKFASFVERLRDSNATGQRETEHRAMQQHHQLLKQHEDLERQVRSGDLASQASVEVLRARNLVEQRENLGGALGSMQASAALYHFADQAKGERYRKQPVVINVGSKVALADKLKRLGAVRAEKVYHPTLGYQIHTDTDALRKYVGRTESDKADAGRWRDVKHSVAGVEHDAEGREWVPGYKVPGFRSHFGEASSLPADQQHLSGQPIRFLADQRNNIEWLHGSGGGLVTMRTGGGKTVTSVGVAAKMLHENPDGRHLRIVPDGREEQWASEIRNFTSVPVTVLPASSTKDERARALAAAPKGSVVVVGHTNAGRYDHEALATTHAWDSIGIDEPQELRAKSGSGKLGAGAKRLMRIPAKNRHALTATPATDHPVEAFDIVNWARPKALGFRTRFQRAFAGFGSGTNAQDAALERALYRELEPHVSGERLVAPHYGIEHNDVRVRMSDSQLTQQRAIESRVDATIQTAVDEAKAKKQAGEKGYAERSYAALYKEARERTMAKLEGEHRGNLSGGDTGHNPKLAAMQKAIAGAGPSERHVVFVDSADQRRAVTSMLEGMGHKGKVKNITASAKGDTVKRGGADVSAIEERKRDWKATNGGFLVIDRSSASGHNLAEGDHLHVLGNPDDAAQMLQAHGRLGRANREGDFAIHTYRYDDSPFEHTHWNRLERQLKVLRATAPGMFVEGKRREPQAALAKGSNGAGFRLLLRRILGRP